MDRKNNQSESSEYSGNTRASKTDQPRADNHSKTSKHSRKPCSSDSSRPSRSNCTNYSDTEASRPDCNKSSDESCDRDESCTKDSCSYDCGLKYSSTPIGVWNMIFSCENACTTTGTMEWINQLMLNGDETASSYSIPDVGHSPFPHLLSTGLGVWKHNDRKIKLELSHIGYRHSDGNPQGYYRVKIIMKLNNKGTKARFRGEACLFDISDPTMCSPADSPALCFEGCGVKVLEPCYAK